MRIIDLTGCRFGRLTVISKYGNDKYGSVVWHCACDCGNTVNVNASNLKSGRQVSCGCYDAERKLKHGHAAEYTAEYRAWKNIRKRCYNEKDNFYPEYGGRGIKVCDRWNTSFENFFEDMGKRPTPKYSIDRIDVNGDYSPDNCKWSTMSEQIINQRIRRDNTSGYKGISWDKSKSKWHVYITIYKKRTNVGYFEELTEAINARKVAEDIYHNKLSTSP